MPPNGDPNGRHLHPWLRALLFLWAAGLPIHRLPFATPIDRAGLGEWLFPIALVAGVPLVARRREALVVPLLYALLLPSVVFALDRHAAVVQLAIFVYVASILVLARAVTLQGAGPALLAGIITGAAVTAIWGFIEPQRDAWLVARWPRPLGLLESPNMVAMQACAGILAALVLGRSWRYVAVAAFAITAVMTFGHVAIVAMTTALFVGWRTTTGRNRRAFAVAGVLAVTFVIASMRVRFFPLSSVAPYIDLRPPLYVPPHAIALETFASSPVVGVGLECFTLAWPTHDDGMRFAASYAGGLEYLLGVPLDTHSTWLGLLAEAGVFGALVLAGLLALAWRSRGRTLALDAALVFAAGVSLFLDVLTSRELALVFGVLLAQRPARTRAAAASISAARVSPRASASAR